LTDARRPFRYADGATLYGSIGRIGHSNVSGCSYRITKCQLGARVQSRAHNSCSHVPVSRGCPSCQTTRLRLLLTPGFGRSAGLGRRASMPDRDNDPFVGAVGLQATGTPIANLLTRSSPIRSGAGQLFFENRCSCARARRGRHLVAALAGPAGDGLQSDFNDMRCRRQPLYGVPGQKFHRRQARLYLGAGRGSRRPPRNHRVGRGPLVNNNEP